jgi:hypothetical protein
MTRRQKEPLRPFSEQEHQLLEQLSRAQQEPAVHVLRAQLLLGSCKKIKYHLFHW